jgi:hypothetical protein
LGIEPILFGSRSGTSSPKGVWRPILGLEFWRLFLLFLGGHASSRRSREAQRFWSNLRAGCNHTDLNRLGTHSWNAPKFPPSLSLQRKGFSRALPELGPYVHVSPLRKDASCSFMSWHVLRDYPMLAPDEHQRGEARTAVSSASAMTQNLATSDPTPGRNRVSTPNLFDCSDSLSVPRHHTECGCLIEDLSHSFNDDFLSFNAWPARRFCSSTRQNSLRSRAPSSRALTNPSFARDTNGCFRG